jgi:hypothetical protein
MECNKKDDFTLRNQRSGRRNFFGLMEATSNFEKQPNAALTVNAAPATLTFMP